MKRRPTAVVSCALLVGASYTVGCSSDAGDEGVEAAADALRTCAKGPTITGLDVSYYQGKVDWAKVKSAGRTFAFVRVSDGLANPDSRFAQNWPGAKAAGLVRGPYQYFRPSRDPNQQARFLLDRINAAGGLLPGDLPPVLDLETTDGLPARVVVARARTWLTTVEAMVGVKPIIYTAAFMSNVIGASFSSYVLWVANYRATCPLMPSGWNEWHFWQTSDRGRVAGVPGNVDTDLFNGSLVDLKNLTLGAAPSSDPARADGVGGLTPLGFDAVGVEAAHPGDGPNDAWEGATMGSAMAQERELALDGSSEDNAR